MRNARLPLFLLLVFFLIFNSCVDKQQKQKPAARTYAAPALSLPKQKSKNQSMIKVRSVQKEASLSVVQARVPDIIAEIKKASQADKPMVYEAINQLSDHPHAAQEPRPIEEVLPQ